MTIKNPKLESLTYEEILKVSDEYLMGWQDLSRYGFRVKGLNNRRVAFGLPELTKEMSLNYRLQYIREHYTYSEIYNAILQYVQTHRVADDRWKGIEVLDCRFGKEYTVAFKALLGSNVYRKLSETMRIQKLRETQIDMYGGVGVASQMTMAKVKATNIHRYGTENVMKCDAIKENLAKSNQMRYGGPSPFSSVSVQKKAALTKLIRIQQEMEQFRAKGIINNQIFKQSPAEMIVFYELIKRFGKHDVYYQYGIHPKDIRYPFNCDFYVKSLDLFIELNIHYSHGKHWFDRNNHDDCLRQKHLTESASRKSRTSLKTWCETDVRKRKFASDNQLNYLVIWDTKFVSVNGKLVPCLRDFYQWLIDYDCNTNVFLKDHPENTY